jgi:hypothetical protein
MRTLRELLQPLIEGDAPIDRVVDLVRAGARADALAHVVAAVTAAGRADLAAELEATPERLASILTRAAEASPRDRLPALVTAVIEADEYIASIAASIEAAEESARRDLLADPDVFCLGAA